jgi:hypothetical protein
VSALPPVSPDTIDEKIQVIEGLMPRILQDLRSLSIRDDNPGYLEV